MVNSERPIIHHKRLEGCHCPTGAGVGQSRYTGVADLVFVEPKLLQMQVWHPKQDCQAWRTHMSKLKAWDQSTAAPTHLQLRHGPNGVAVFECSHKLGHLSVTPAQARAVKLLHI